LLLNVKIQLSLLALFVRSLAPIRAHATPVCDSVPGNLIQNCGFEIFDHTFPDWTVGGITTVGIYGLRLETLNNGSTTSVVSLSQSLSLNPQDTYTLSFYLGSTGGTSNSFSAALGGDTLFNGKDMPPSDFTDVPASQFNYGYEFFTYTGLGGNGVLEFSLQDNPGYLWLDDVSLVKDSIALTPEPGSLVLFGLGLLMVVFIGRRRITESRKTMKDIPAVA